MAPRTLGIRLAVSFSVGVPTTRDHAIIVVDRVALGANIAGASY